MCLKCNFLVIFFLARTRRSTPEDFTEFTLNFYQYVQKTVLVIRCATTEVYYTYFICILIPYLINNMSRVYVNFYSRVVVILKD